MKNNKGLQISAVLIAVNFVLFSVKLYVGLAVSSLSIYTDAMNNLLDCVWMVARDYTPTYTDGEERSWRPSYVYASTEAWNAVTSVEVLDCPSGGMKHKPVKVTLKY